MIRKTLLLAASTAASLGAQAQRPMTFLDVQNMRQVNGQDLSPDGRQMLYVLSTPDWANARGSNGAMCAQSLSQRFNASALSRSRKR